MNRNIPTILTYCRIVAISVVVILYYLPFHWGRLLAAAVFVIAAITDWLDGYIARKWGQMTAFGAFLDPVADKLLVAVALIIVVSGHTSALLAIAAAVIVGREIIISALREWMAEIGKRASVAVSFIGKVKTAVQFVAVTLLLAASSKPPLTIFYVGLLFLVVAALLTCWSMVIYLKLAWPDLTLSKEQ